ncbi:unnamed protein product [Bursaphelenchus xylophilus]|uniref:(pine wood nematode) hypothetical protein n=1 Tax=Bursaphelenchus xylophilus TaxID=6326 RepID=A0A1I7RU62_BURXY|nr:unnamed protein product [Bursaphelenchus xylophilus]CAG9113850.1 unnamed protein product [Bursaphelenchus xylophilus]
MRIRVGYGRERRPVDAVDQLNFGAVKENIRQIFGFSPNVQFTLKLGNEPISLEDGQFLAEAGVVSGDLLMVEVLDGEDAPSVENKVEQGPSSQQGPSGRYVEHIEPEQTSETVREFDFNSVKEILMEKLKRLCQFTVKNESVGELSDPVRTLSVLFDSPVNPWTQAHLTVSFYGMGQPLAKVSLTLISEKGNMKEFGPRTVISNGFQKDLAEFCEEIRQFLLGPYNKFLNTFFVGPAAGLAWRLCQFLDPGTLISLSAVNRYMNDYSNRMSFDNKIWKEKLAEFSGKAPSELPTPSEHKTYKKSLIKALKEQRRRELERQQFERQFMDRPQHDPLVDPRFSDPLRVDPRDRYRPPNPWDAFDDRWRGGEVFPNHRPRRDPANPLIVPRPPDPNFQPDFQPDPDMPQGPRRWNPPRRGDPGSGGGFFGPGAGFIG